MAYATWNSSDKASKVTLSNGNLTAASASSDTTWGSVRSNIGVSSGKYYWEVTINSIDAGRFIMIGVAQSGASITSYLGASSVGWQYYGEAGNKINNDSQVGYGATFTSGDIIGVALDRDAGTLTFYKNGTTQGQAYSGLSGTIYAGVSLRNIGNQITANFGASAFAYTPPSGFVGLSDSTDATVTPAAASATFSVPAPTVITDAVLSPAVVAATFSVPAPIVSGAALVTPAAASATFSVPPPTVLIADTTVEAEVASATFSVPAPTVITDAVMTPEPVVATFSVPTPAIEVVAHVTLTPSPVVLTLSVLHPTRIGGLWQNQSRQSTTWTNQERPTA